MTTITTVLDTETLLSREWMLDAACRDTDTEVFFPESDDETDRAEAVALCHSCPVAAMCAAYALATGATDGVAAGVYLPGVYPAAGLLQARRHLREIAAGTSPVPAPVFAPQLALFSTSTGALEAAA